MPNFSSMEHIVLDALLEKPQTRKDDYILMVDVCERIQKDLLSKPFGEVLRGHIYNGMPNWETVTRCRRKLQEEYPELSDDNTTRHRRKKEQEYIDYALEGKE